MARGAHSLNVPRRPGTLTRLRRHRLLASRGRSGGRSGNGHPKNHRARALTRRRADRVRPDPGLGFSSITLGLGRWLLSAALSRQLVHDAHGLGGEFVDLLRIQSLSRDDGGRFSPAALEKLLSRSDSVCIPRGANPWLSRGVTRRAREGRPHGMKPLPVTPPTRVDLPLFSAATLGWGRPRWPSRCSTSDHETRTTSGAHRTPQVRARRRPRCQCRLRRRS